MEFIVTIFDKSKMYEIAYKMCGNIVNDNEFMIIISANTEYDLNEEMKAKFSDVDFDTEPLKNEGYDSDRFSADKMINWSELSRKLSGGKTVVSRNRTPIKHQVAVERLKLNIENWYEALYP